MQNLTNKIKTMIVSDAVAAGSTDISDMVVVDTQGFEGCRFVIRFGTITANAVTSVKVKQGAAASSATALTSGADLEGTQITVADDGDDSLYIIDVYRPRERYLQLYVDRATQNAEVDFAIAELYGARKLPVTKHDDVASQELHASPAEGTA